MSIYAKVMEKEIDLGIIQLSDFRNLLDTTECVNSSIHNICIKDLPKEWKQKCIDAGYLEPGKYNEEDYIRIIIDC